MPAARRLGRELLSFAAVGVVGLAVDVAVLYALAPGLGWYGARVVSFWAAASATWALNRRFTFAHRARGGSVAREYLAYLATMLGGGGVNYGAYALTLYLLHGPLAAALGVALGSLAGMGVNFLAARYLVFRGRSGRA